MFLFALSEPSGWRGGLQVVEWVVLGCAGGILIQLCGWFIRPQHPVRHAVAESWVAASDLIGAMRMEPGDTQPRLAEISGKESDLRATLDRTLHAVGAATTNKRLIFFQHLDDAAQVAGRLATRVSALHTALEALRARPDFAGVAPTLDLLLQALANAARSAALTLITHRPEQQLALEIRLQRCAHLGQIFDSRLAALPGAHAELAQTRQMLAQIEVLLPQIRLTIQETVDHGASHPTLSLRLPELSGFSLRYLSAWLNPAPQLDPVLIRHALRSALIMMLAVAVYKWFDIPRGYWIAFTAVIVLQPDYGSTRQKAGQRIVGTLAGCALASLLLWIKIPVPVLMALSAVTSFCFAYFMKRRYGLAVFCVTLMLVLITDAVEPVHWEFTLDRLLSTLAGGGMALVAALFLWPNWEQEQFPKIFGAALRANRNYLAAIVAALTQGEPFAGAIVEKKREAERANSLASASLQRLVGEPASRQNQVERAAALTAYNQRLTRAATVLALHLNQRAAFRQPPFLAFSQAIGEALADLAGQIEAGKPPITPLPIPPPSQPDAGDSAATLIYGQLAKIVVEIEAMTLAKDATPVVSEVPALTTN